MQHISLCLLILFTLGYNLYFLNALLKGSITVERYMVAQTVICFILLLHMLFPVVIITLISIGLTLIFFGLFKLRFSLTGEEGFGFTETCEFLPELLSYYIQPQATPNMPKINFQRTPSLLEETQAVWVKCNSIICEIYHMKSNLPLTERLRIASDGVLDRTQSLLDGSLTGAELESQNLIVMLTFTWLKLMTGFMAYGTQFYHDPACVTLLQCFEQLHSGRASMDYNQDMFVKFVKRVSEFPRQGDTITRKHLQTLYWIFTPMPWGIGSKA
jgi:hypothetical protein